MMTSATVPTFVRLAAATCIAASAAASSTTTAFDYDDWPPLLRDAQLDFEFSIMGMTSAESLQAWHARFASEPHPGGSPGDARMIETMVDALDDFKSLEVTRHVIHPLLSFPVDASLEITAPADAQRKLAVTEAPVDGDPSTARDDLPIGFNAYAATGTVEAGVVYVNYGRKQDFETLARLGVDLTGQIALARYGGNYRGFKAKYAEEAGAIGLVMYTDPADSGYMRGQIYPDGGWANGSSIQRGSIVTKPWAGDPLTPFVEATKDAARIDESEAFLPTIPVQPIGWDAAQPILEAMNGDTLPRELIGGWQGGLPLAYHLKGGDLRLRLHVEQERRITETANVIARIEGTEMPDEIVVLGCHHDAWGCGASDPTAGLMVLFELAQTFAKLADDGYPPRRTLIFAAWGAEEYGIIGSTEWVEANRAMLGDGAVAYINLDMAAMGSNMRASTTPMLRRIISDAAKLAAQPGDGHEIGTTVWDVWTQGESRPAPLGRLGGGSDHVPFVCHVGVPSIAISAGGSPGTAYHSNYDTLAWYRTTVEDGYASGKALTDYVGILASRLANAPLIQYDPTVVASDTLESLEGLKARAAKTDLGDAAERVNAAFEALAGDIALVSTQASRVWPLTRQASRRTYLDRADYAAINESARRIAGAWVDQRGLPDRRWFRNLSIATDPTNGYANWVLPGIRAAIEAGDADQLEVQIVRIREVFGRINAHLADIEGRVAEATERAAAEE